MGSLRLDLSYLCRAQLLFETSGQDYCVEDGIVMNQFVLMKWCIMISEIPILIHIFRLNFFLCEGVLTLEIECVLI